MSNSFTDIEKARALLIIGSNTTECHPIIARRIKNNIRSNGCRLVVADPRATELSELADIHLNHAPGTDVVLLNGIMNEIVRKGWHDTDFIKDRCEDFEAFETSLDRYDPSYVAYVAGVTEEQIKAAARILGKSPTVTVIYGMGITQHTTGTDNVKAIANLLMLTGNMGYEGTGFSPLRGQNNVQGACDMGALPNVYPGYQPVVNPDVRSKFSRLWKAHLDSRPGLPMTDMIKAAQKNDLFGMYVVGENPMMSEPDLLNARKAIGKLQFLVVQDIFLTETARMADVVLPAACFAEKDGTFTNTERRIQRLRKIVDPPDRARVDWKIISDIANRMGYPMTYASSAQIMEEIARLTPIYGGVSQKRLKKTGGLQWPCWDANHPGTERLHENQFTRGRGKFHVVHHQAPAEVPSDDYPLLLTTGRILEHFHTGSMSRRCHVLKTIVPDGRIDLHPKDVEALGAEDGDRIEVISKRGEVATTIHKDRRIQPGMAFMAFHWHEAPANVLTNDAYDPVSKIPEFKVSSVKLKRIKLSGLEPR
jgi:formate dehydrogenase alpha subunit